MIKPRTSDLNGLPAEPVLLGRDQELRLLRDFLGRVCKCSSTLLLAGGAGVGKTALLDAAAKAAADKGMLVLRAAGSEFESDLGFAALNQALIPVLEYVEQLGAGHREALAIALGLREGKAGDRLMISTAVLLLLRRVAADCPVLLIVDDLPWVDRASATVLNFVVRRLTGSKVGFLGAVRSNDDDMFSRHDLPRRWVAPLGERASAELLDRNFPNLAGQARTRLLAEARGNPLAILELPTARSRPRPLTRSADHVPYPDDASEAATALPPAAHWSPAQTDLGSRLAGPAIGQATVIVPMPLTPQEQEVALMAASGLTNKQIGQRLFMSHRTVGAHLYHLFPKLGVSTRAGLRDALSGRANAEPASLGT
jgi:DNA-binding CsgD family transcriptional regulator